MNNYCRAPLKTTPRRENKKYLAELKRTYAIRKAIFELVYKIDVLKQQEGKGL